MKRSTPPRPGRRLATKGVAAALATATAATVAGMAATPAQSAPTRDCPGVFDIGSLEPGQPVTGLTVTKGITPEEFSGEVLGVLKDGILPGIDMIMVQLGADTTGVDKKIFDVGVWSGMSGSPVYAQNGDLIGAVAYGLSLGPSTIAGVTPAADMHKLIDAGTDPAARPARNVEVSEPLEQRAVTSGAATEEQVESGLTQLRLPLTLSGISGKRLPKLDRKLNLPEVRMGAGSVGGAELDASSIMAGGNLAAAVSYGDISFAGVGTATLVCGEEVVGFGHPMMWKGPTGLSLHPASAIYVQPDPTLSGFKVANVGDPVGTIDQDRMAGIAGSFGTAPVPTEITSHVTSPTEVREGTSYVNLSEWVPDVALFHLLTNEDKAFDGIGEGSGTVSYDITGTVTDGTEFTLSRADVYADKYDLTWRTAWDLYMNLWRLEGNRVEDISISNVVTHSELSREYVVSSIESVSVKQGGKWVPLGRRLMLPAGTVAQFKANLVTTGGGTSAVRLELPIRQSEAGRHGYLEVAGGNTIGSWFSGRDLPIDELIERIESAPHNNDVLVSMRLFREQENQRNIVRTDVVPAEHVVNGGKSTRLIIVGGR